MSKFEIWAHKNVRLETLTIEAESEEEAKQKYSELVNDAEVSIESYQWSSFSEGDCNVE